MNLSVRMVAAWILLGAAVSCGPSDDSDVRQSQLALKPGAVIDEPDCSHGEACPEGTRCYGLRLSGGLEYHCADGAALCEKIECASGRCIELLSEPAQLLCVIEK